ncbi:MAG: DUF4230 domain-containing protein [Bacteroidota bacterium]
MADDNYQGPPPVKRRSSIYEIGRKAFIIAALSIGAMVGIKYCNINIPNPVTGEPIIGDATTTRIPKELHINYIPAEYDANLDEEDALVILSNPNRYRRDFDQLVYDFNLSLLEHVANRMNLSTEIKSQLESEYQKHHPYLKDLYFQDFIALKDTTDNYQQLWYETDNANAVEVLNEVASKYTCSFINTVITSLLQSGSSPLAAAGKFVETPCGVALKEGLAPMIRRLEAKAAIADFGKAKGFLEEKVEKAVSELATMEVRDKKGLNTELKTNVWGVNVSSTDIEISAISILKVGFKLNDLFDITVDENRNTVTITLPEPQILSHEVYPKVDKLEVGWMREVKDEDFNKNFNLLRREFRNDALNSDIMSKAKQEAVELMDLMFSPVVAGLNKRYKLQVRFQRMVQDVDAGLSSLN